MKPLLTILILAAFFCSSVLAQPVAQGRTLTQLNVIPARVLQRSVSPKFYNSLLKSPIQGWIVVRAQLSGTHLAGIKIIHSELKGLFDPLALKLANEAVIAGDYTIERPNLRSSVLLHLLVYQIADGTMVLSFAHLDEPGGNQADYYGCARLLVLKADKWTEIQGPVDLAGKGWAVRRGMKNNLEESLKVEKLLGAETVNMRTYRDNDDY
jgi:hypothetical protein